MKISIIQFFKSISVICNGILLIGILIGFLGFKSNAQTVLIPFTGSNSVDCGNNVTLCPHNGCGNYYSNNANGYTILYADGTSVININGSYALELNWDLITIYSGAGIGGTTLAQYSNPNGLINYTGAPGQTLTVWFLSSNTLTNAGFTLNVTYTAGCIPTCALGVTASANTNNFCDSGTPTLTANSTGANGAVTYNWMPGNISGASITPSVTSTTTFTVTATDTAPAGCTATDTVTVTIYPTYSENQSASICQGDTYIFPDGTTATSATVHTSYFNTIHSCDSIIITTLTINPAYTSNTSASICQGETYTFPDGTTSTTATVHTSLLTSLAGCDSSIVTTLTVNSITSINVAAGSTLFCENSGTTALVGIPAGGTWSGAGVSGNSFDPTLSGTGNFSVIYSYTNANGCTNFDTIMMTVNAIPSISVAAADTLFCVNDPNESLLALPSGGSWTGSGITGNFFSPSLAGVGNQIITYSYIDGNGCSNAASLNMIVDVCTSINEMNDYNFISIYPNPTSGQFTIVFSTDNATITITDLLGQQILKTQTTQKSAELQLDNNGVYIVYVTTQQGTTTRKLIVNL